MQSLSVRAYVQHYTQALAALYDVAEARSIVRNWLECRLGITPKDYWLDATLQLTTRQEQQLEDDLRRLLQYEPWQYVVQRAYFDDMWLHVTPDVLIPRPETEELVHHVVQLYQKKIAPQRIIDICTGSGCIAIALKKHFPSAEVIAIDISEKALSVAQRNAAEQQTAITLQQADVLQVPAIPSADLIVSNPPYVTLQEKTQILPNVLQYEPHLALFVPDEQPLLFYEKIAALAEHSLSQNGILAFELNTYYAQAAAAMLQAKNTWQEIRLLSDLNDKPRFLLAQKT